MDDILRLRQLFREKPLVILYLRGPGLPLPPLGHVGQQLIRLQLQSVQETARLRVNIVRTDRDIQLLEQRFRQVAHTVRSDQDEPPLHLLENQDILFQVGLPCLLAQAHQLFGQNAEHRRLQ